MNIRKALSWKLLKQYGGKLSIEDFREMFNTVNTLTENIEYNSNKPTGKLPLNPVKITYLDWGQNSKIFNYSFIVFCIVNKLTSST